MDCSPPGFSVHGILQARILEWVAMPTTGDLPNPGIKPMPFTFHALAGGFFTTSATWKDQCVYSEWSRSAVSNSLWPHGRSLPGSSVHGIFQARILEWLAISFSRGSSQPRDRTQVSCIVGRHFIVWATREARMLLLLRRFSRVQLCATPDTAAHQASRPWDSPGKNTGVGCHFLLQCRKVKSESEVAHSCPTLATPWTAAYQAPPSTGFSRQEYWSGVPLPSPGKPL